MVVRGFWAMLCVLASYWTWTYQLNDFGGAMEFAQFIALSNTTYFVVDSQVFFCRWRCGDYRRKSVFLFAKLLGYNYLVVGCAGFILATAVNYFLSIRFVFRSGARFSKKELNSLSFTP